MDAERAHQRARKPDGKERSGLSLFNVPSIDPLAIEPRTLTPLGSLLVFFLFLLCVGTFCVYFSSYSPAPPLPPPRFISSAIMPAPVNRLGKDSRARMVPMKRWMSGEAAKPRPNTTAS